MKGEFRIVLHCVLRLFFYPLAFHPLIFLCNTYEGTMKAIQRDFRLYLNEDQNDLGFFVFSLPLKFLWQPSREDLGPFFSLYVDDDGFIVPFMQLE